MPRLLGGMRAQSNPTLARVVGAFGYLPRAIVIDPTHTVPGPWVVNSPLWGNPVLIASDDSGGLENEFPDLFGLSGFDSVGIAIRCKRAMQEVYVILAGLPAGRVHPVTRSHCSRIYQHLCLMGVLGLGTLQSAPVQLRDGLGAAKRIDELLTRLPVGWAEAASIVIEGPDGIAAAPPIEEAWSRIVRSLGWRIGSLTFPLTKLSTKVATWMQMQFARDKLRKKHGVLVGERHWEPPSHRRTL